MNQTQQQPYKNNISFIINTQEELTQKIQQQNELQDGHQNQHQNELQDDHQNQHHNELQDGQQNPEQIQKNIINTQQEPTILYAIFNEYKQKGGRPRRYELEKIEKPHIQTIKNNLITILDEKQKNKWFEKCSINKILKPKDKHINITNILKPIYAIIFNANINLKPIYSIDHNKFAILYILHTRKPPNNNRRGPKRINDYATFITSIIINKNRIYYDSNYNIHIL